MQKIKFHLFLVFGGVIMILSILYIQFASSSLAWGFYGHKQINRMAVFTLPSEMVGFYKSNIEFISTHAVDADKRRYVDDNEAARHFIDIDRYGQHPFDSIPKQWTKAVEKYTEDSLKAHGIVPWYINLMLSNLTAAFQEKNNEKILRLSTDMGHYIADAHVPLHTTRNYNGQLTNQKGIHGFWESRIPELKGDHYNYFVGKANYIEKPLEKIWSIIQESYRAKDSVLHFEAQLNNKYEPDKKYSFEERGKKIVKVYSKEYAEEYEKMLNGMVERRMRQSIIDVASFWYTAWVNAGQPELNMMDKLVVISDTSSHSTLSTKEIHGHED